MKKTITNTNDFVTQLNIELTEDEKNCFDIFFKKKIMHIDNNKIIYPKLTEIKKKITEFDAEINSVEKKIIFWTKNKKKLEKYKKSLPLNTYFQKNYWRHKIKEITNKEYKQDVIDTKLNDKILLDPEYKNLFETFLLNPDYRKKLKETVTTSIVYKQNGIGAFSEKKKEFKIKNSELKIKQLKQKLIENKNKKQIFTKIFTVIKKNV